MVVLRKQLRIGSRRWKTTHDVNLLGGVEACRRKVRLLVCAREKMDIAFAAHQEQVLWSSALFSIMQEGSRT